MMYIPISERAKIAATALIPLLKAFQAELGTERANEIALREKAAQKAEEKHGVEIDRREMSLITPNEQPEQEKE